VEITDPGTLSLAMFNQTLSELKLPPVKREDLSPLLSSCVEPADV